MTESEILALWQRTFQLHRECKDNVAQRVYAVKQVWTPGEVPVSLRPAKSWTTARITGPGMDGSLMLTFFEGSRLPMIKWGRHRKPTKDGQSPSYGVCDEAALSYLERVAKRLAEQMGGQIRVVAGD